MHFRSTVFTFSLILLTGCLSLARPSKRHREEVSARAAKEFVAHRSKLDKVTFLVLASNRAASFGSSSNNHELSLAKISFSPKTLGFREFSRDSLPHDSLADCRAPPCLSRTEIPPELAPRKPGSSPPTQRHDGFEAFAYP